MKAVFNDQVIAESDNTVIVEGNHYFPIESVKREFLTNSNTHTTCAWKGIASYYNVVVNGETASDAAWYYPNPSTLAEGIKGHVAFWNGVNITK